MLASLLNPKPPSFDLFHSASEEELVERKVIRNEMKRREKLQYIADLKSKVRRCVDRGNHRWRVIRSSGASWSTISLIHNSSSEEFNKAIRQLQEEERKEREKQEETGPWYCEDCFMEKSKTGVIRHPYLSDDEQMLLRESIDGRII